MTIDYRLAPRPSAHVFPIPIHDVFTALDYIADPQSPHNGNTIPQISLLGSHIGGALATSLALIQPNFVHAVAISEPLVDWPGLDELTEAKKSKGRPRSKSSQPGSDDETQAALQTLLTLRSKLFTSPAGYFDPFASPILFLRAPGRDTPLSHDESYYHFQDEHDIDVATFGPYDDDVQTQTQTSSPCTPPTTSPENIKRRKVLRPFSPSFSLPPFRVSIRDPTATYASGQNHILASQGIELVDLLRRACFIGHEQGVAERRVRLDVLPDMEEDDQKKGGFVGLERAVEWLGGKMREDRRS